MTSGGARSPLDEVAHLRAALRDLVAFSSLPAIWSGYQSDEIAESVAGALLKILSLDLTYIRVPRIGGDKYFELALAGGDEGAPCNAQSVGDALSPWLGDLVQSTAIVQDPLGRGPLRIAIARFGHGTQAGVLVAGSTRDAFPSEQDRVLLSVAANQAAVALNRNEIERERLELLSRERESRQEAQSLNELAQTLGVELDLERLVQKVTDHGRELTGAEYAAFFYNAVNEQGESYLLYTLSGAPREAFDRFGLPRNTELFAPTFRGEHVERIDDVLKDPRYGKSAPHFGMPPGHLPVCSYLAAPVISRTGSVLGGLFFGHSQVGVFTEPAERLVLGLAAHAAIAIDNASLYNQAQQQLAERTLAEERERVARTEAERASRLRDDFLAIVSHELRTPLNGVLGWAQLLRQIPHDEQLRVEAVDAIERGARAQARIIDDLLDMSRIVSGKLRLDVQTLELVRIIQAAVDTVRPAADAKAIRLECVLDPSAEPVKGDAARIQQIVWNLLSNAVKFTPKGGRVQVHLERVNSHLEISVSDSGQGIVPDFLPHVFDRFRQADSSTTRFHGGLGLGLAIVKQLVELHGGNVSVKSPGEGQGTTFTVNLPVAIMVDDADGREHPAAPRDANDVLPQQVDLAGTRVLVIDDDRDSAEMLRRVLQESGAEVELSGSAREGLAKLARMPFDVLLSDIGMPDVDGYQLMRELRASGQKLPAVAVTAFARSEDRIRALQAGYNMHLAKPMEPRELKAVIANLLTNRSGN